MKPTICLLGTLMLLGAAFQPVGARGVPPTFPTFQILDVTFTDAQHLWALGLHCTPQPSCSKVVFTYSVNGGRTWSAALPVPAKPRFEGKGPSVARVGSLRFVTPRDGYAFDPSLLSSHDGGKTWAWNRRLQNIVALEPIGRQAWAVQDLCTRAGACPLYLYRTDPGRDAWQRSPLPLRSPAGSVQIVAGKKGQAWILASQQPHSGPFVAKSALITTRDGGRTWLRLPDPCSPGDSFIDRLATIDGRHLWLVCGGEPSAGGELMSLFRSPDGGRRWRLTASNEHNGRPYFVYGGYVDSLAVTGPDTAWFSLDRGTLYRTVDGGKTWRAGIHQAVSDSTVGPVLFSGPLHGWLASFPSTIFRTTDGGRSWQSVTLH